MHNRLAKQIVAQIADYPIVAGWTMADVMALCECVLVGVLVRCFELGSDVKMLDVIVGRVKERLTKVRLEKPRNRWRGDGFST